MKKLLNGLLALISSIKTVIAIAVIFVLAVFALPVFAADGTMTGAMGIIEWIKANWESVLAIIGGVVSVATVIVKLTPSQKDDNILATIINILSVFSLVNPDGSFVGKKKD